MKTVSELNTARAAALKKVVLRKANDIIAKEAKSDYKYTVLVCGGTGCTSSHSTEIVEKLNTEIKSAGIEKDVQVILTGCFGLCALGPIMIVYPEGCFYSMVEIDSVPRIVKGPVDDCTIAIYRFPNGVSGKVFVSIGCIRDYTMRSVFYGTRGTIICDNTSPTITLYEKEPADGRKFTAPEKIPVVINNHNVVAEIDVFVNALLSGEQMPITSMEGAATVAVACATVEAAKVGHPIQIRYPQV